MKKIRRLNESEYKTFDISNRVGILNAEKYQNNLYKKYDSVKVELIGNDKLKITGTDGVDINAKNNK